MLFAKPPYLLKSVKVLMHSGNTETPDGRNHHWVLLCKLDSFNNCTDNPNDEEKNDIFEQIHRYRCNDVFPGGWV